ncbi:peptidyl-prolyl cis-trans isomerase [Salinimicrobium sp. TH3]|uniref:peptidyl-prolyl cis-trans isomerase n=1 Tax=Salinimicrobium sp. TH3 TaxID=2997342 RepID=UPI002272E603|nr:peptidyl-prolyl cis-trans isomerase [Salinimicrobium sp. TH3]MCY2687914.1 peptidyl-prolyl cis-trans isomerase [Salinimicrobium sp. TH3]
MGFLTGSCNFLNEPEEKEVIARVNDAYLYRDDVAPLVSENTSAEDSTLLINNFITRWATQKLLLDRARVNLSGEQQAEFDRLVQNYKNELYAKAYTDAIVGRELDTNITREAAEAYYEENGENFILNENLVKVRYINITKNNSDFETIKTRFRRFNEEDKIALLDMAIQFNSYSLNDSVWVKTKQVYDKIRPLSPQDDPEFLKNKNFMQLEDSLGVYLISVEDVRLRNEQAPIEYSLPGIKQILLNKRKLDLIKKLEKDITQDAIKNDEFEIYN